MRAAGAVVNGDRSNVAPESSMPHAAKRSTSTSTFLLLQQQQQKAPSQGKEGERRKGNLECLKVFLFVFFFLYVFFFLFSLLLFPITGEIVSLHVQGENL